MQKKLSVWDSMVLESDQQAKRDIQNKKLMQRRKLEELKQYHKDQADTRKK